MKTSHSFDEQFEFQGKAKTWSLVMIVVSVLLVYYRRFLTGNGERTFANLLLMSYYFACVCISGIFFLRCAVCSTSGLVGVNFACTAGICQNFADCGHYIISC